MSNPVRWYKRDGKGFTIDVKLEKAPGFQWSWRLLRDASIELMKLGTQVMTDRLEEGFRERRAKRDPRTDELIDEGDQE